MKNWSLIALFSIRVHLSAQWNIIIEKFMKDIWKTVVVNISYCEIFPYNLSLTYISCIFVGRSSSFPHLPQH